MSKVLFVSNSDWNLVNFRSPLINELVHGGHHVVCVSGKSEQEIDSTKLSQVEWIYLKHISARGTNPITELILCNELYGLLKFHKPDLVICYTLKINCYAGILCGFLRIPYLINITGLGSEFKKDKGYSFVIKSLLRKSCIHSNCILFHNDDDRLRLISDRVVEESKTRVVNGSGINILHFTSQRKVVSVNNFIFIGRMLKEKGILVFIQAALILSKRYKHLKFYIIGDQYKVKDPEVTHMIQLAKSDSIFVFGEFTKEVWSMLDKTDCFVLPSHREGLSKALMEAMSMRRIVIASNVPGCKELIVNEYNGYLMKDISVEALVCSMEEVLSLNESQIERLSNNARATIQNNYTTTHIVKQYMDVIAPILS